MCGMPPPVISMQMNTMCTELSLSSFHFAAELLYGALWCHGVGFKETQTSQTVVVLQPASARRCRDLVWLLVRRGCTSTWLIPEQDAERKSPPKSSSSPFQPIAF